MRYIAFVLCSLVVSAQDAIFISNIRIVDGTGAPATRGSILLRGERIERIGVSVQPPAGIATINGTGLTALPGLFDVHTHLPYAGVSGITGDWPKTLAAYLLSGVTTVVDFGSYGEMFAPMRKLIANGQVASPRVLLAYRITTPLGHGAEGGRDDIFSLEATTPRQARVAVRKAAAYKPDVIKVFTDGWRYDTAPDMTSMEEDTLTALVDEAHKNNLKVLTHTVTLARAKVAARSKVDVIAHSVGDAPADAELIRLMKESNTSYAGTLAVYEPRNRFTDPLLEAVLDPLARAAIRTPANRTISPARQRRWDYDLANAKTLSEAGINLACGTDAGVTGTYHGWATQHELDLLTKAGLTPMQALTAATSNSAKALGLTDRGVLAPGKLADLLIVEGEPDQRIEDVHKIKHVIRGGRLLNLDGLRDLIASKNVSPMVAQPVKAEIDDFESDSRHWTNSSDGGTDRSKMLFSRIERQDKGHALHVMTTMSEKSNPYVHISVPMFPGGVEPADVSGYKGVRFDVRGAGEYHLLAITRGVRDGDYPIAPFTGKGKWHTEKIDFANLATKKQENQFTGKDLLMLTFEIERPAGTQAWLELDNVRFY